MDEPRCPKLALEGQHCARVSSTLRLWLPGSSHSESVLGAVALRVFWEQHSQPSTARQLSDGV